MEIPASKDMLQVERKLESPEIRVWCHPKVPGNDYFYTFDTFKDAIQFIRTNGDNTMFSTEKQPLIAFRGFEISIFAVKPNE